jgi:molecular chaperone GrpE
MNDGDEEITESDGEEELGGSEEELEAAESRIDTKMGKLRKELEQTKKDKQENLDGWQRAKADYVNSLKRFEEEKKGLVELGKLKAAMAFLPAIDSLERAKGTLSNESLPEGFAGIIKQLETATKDLGLAQFGMVGEKFDHNLHEAFGQETTDVEEEDDTVTAILEPGWKSGENVIRPAKVKVAHFEK